MTAPPENLADRPATPSPDSQPDDLLSELLRSVRLSGERIIAHTPAAPFSLDFADRGTLHIVEKGEVTLKIDGYPHVEHLRGGDFALLPRGDSHSISDAGAAHPGGADTDADADANANADMDAADAGSRQPVRWLCGTFTIGDPQASHLLGSLPAVIILRGSGGDGSPARKALEGLEVARHMIVLEMQFPSQGSAVMVARILDLIFIQIMRTWASGADAEPNWLAGAFDPQIGLALSAIHREPGHDWTVDELARACNLSRSSFAARFVGRVGKPPATYLNHVRLDAATTLLRDTLLPVTQVAETVGYASEAAFSRAFRSRYGTPPARWRREFRLR
jgi:AraC-like DNA-binding protein